MEERNEGADSRLAVVDGGDGGIFSRVRFGKFGGLGLLVAERVDVAVNAFPDVVRVHELRAQGKYSREYDQGKDESWSTFG